MRVVNVSGLKNNPSEALRSARDDVVVVMNRDQPDAMLIGLQSGKLLSYHARHGNRIADLHHRLAAIFRHAICRAMTRFSIRYAPC